jgi:hypothetical protein
LDKIVNVQQDIMMQEWLIVKNAAINVKPVKKLLIIVIHALLVLTENFQAVNVFQDSLIQEKKFANLAQDIAKHASLLLIPVNDIFIFFYLA